MLIQLIFLILNISKPRGVGNFSLGIFWRVKRSINRTIPNQCDKMLEQKVAQYFRKLPPKSTHNSFFSKSDVFQQPKSHTNNLAGFVKCVCYHELSKIAQSGHTVPNATIIIFRVKNDRCFWNWIFDDEIWLRSDSLLELETNILIQHVEVNL